MNRVSECAVSTPTLESLAYDLTKRNVIITYSNSTHLYDFDFYDEQSELCHTMSCKAENLMGVMVDVQLWLMKGNCNEEIIE